MRALSAAIITKNEEARIGRCLASLSWVGEIVVVDSGSSDRTVEICEAAGCRVVRSEWLGFGKTKQRAVESCSNDWVLVVDADEEVSDGLRESIGEVLEDPRCPGYRIRRVSYYLGQRMRHCGWGNEYVLRLFDRNKGRFDERSVHESVVMAEGPVGTIGEPLLHHTCPDIETHIGKMVRYARLSAREQTNATRASIASAVARGLWKFLSMYLFRLGMLDGRRGLILCLNSAFGAYLKRLYIWEMRHGRD